MIGLLDLGFSEGKFGFVFVVGFFGLRIGCSPGVSQTSISPKFLLVSYKILLK